MAEPIIELGSNVELDENASGEPVLRHTPSGAEFTYDSGESEWTLSALNLSGNLTDSAGNSIGDFAGTNLSVSSGTLNASGGGGGSPGGSDTQVQYNDGGSFGGDANLTWNSSGTTFTVEGETDTNDLTVSNAMQSSLPMNGNDVDGAGTVDFNNTTEPQVTSSNSTQYTADLSTSNYHKVTMTGDVSFSVSNADASDVNTFCLQLVQDATGGRTPSFNFTVVWDSGSAPSWSTSANAEDFVTFIHDQDGSQWIGFLGGTGFA